MRRRRKSFSTSLLEIGRCWGGGCMWRWVCRVEGGLGLDLWNRGVIVMQWWKTLTMRPAVTLATTTHHPPINDHGATWREWHKSERNKLFFAKSSLFAVTTIRLLLKAQTLKQLLQFSMSRIITQLIMLKGRGFLLLITRK